MNGLPGENCSHPVIKLLTLENTLELNEQLGTNN